MDVETGAIGSLLPKLNELIEEKYKLQDSIRVTLKHIIHEMEENYAALRKVAMLPRDQLDEQVKLWAEKVRELSYDTEVFDEFLRTHNSEGFKENMGSLLKKGKTRHQIINSAINDFMSHVQDLAERADRYKIYDVVVTASGDPRLVDLDATAENLVSIDGKNYQELMKLVVSDGDNLPNKKLKIISIVGFGGLGKTTLVKAVYDKIERGFDCKAFVVAGQYPDLEKVWRDMISQLTMNNSDNDTCTLNQEQLIEKIREILENKRYLIVIDDIWKGYLWEGTQYAFPSKTNLGSRIITTTRILSVSKACCSSANDSVYQMEPLSDDDSKKLLYERIFPLESGCPHELEQVSRDILKKCHGLPLAINTIASLLIGKETSDEWHALLNTIGRGLEEDVRWENMQMILSLSYYDLPLYLKTCLLYLSTFPVTHRIGKERLVKKLIAEGILTSQELNLEEAGSQYLDELVNRNVIHPLECNNNDEVVTYHIHPMMHVVLKAIAIKQRFAALLDDIDISKAHRMNFPHVSVDCQDSENLIDLSSMDFDVRVRSLTIFGYANGILLRHFEGIRILDLEGCESIERGDLEYICSMVLLKWLCLAKTHITELPPQIGNLKYLEGLDLGGTQITQLPPEICNLQYLEGLVVGGTQITQLPPQIGKLQHLKTLDARKTCVQEIPAQVLRLTGLVRLLIGDNESCEGVKLPVGIGKMISLQQLGTIDLRKCSVSSLRELGELPDLEYIAVVSSDEPEDTRINNALLSSLEKSTKLRSLVVYSDFRLTTLQSSTLYKLNCQKKLTLVKRSFRVPIIIAELRFLGMLDIRICKLEEDDLKILRELPRLHSLIVRLEVLPTEMLRISCEGFAKLESFYVDCRMPRVIFEEGAMPKLEHLELKLYAGSASEEHMCIKHLLSLQKVTLRYCKWYATNKGVQKITEALKAEAKEHQNEITLCIAEEEKNGECIPKTEEVFQENGVASSSKMTETEKEEVFQENRVASCSRMPETEEKEDTQEGGLHQSSRAIASCSGTSEIEEVGE